MWKNTWSSGHPVFYVTGPWIYHLLRLRSHPNTTSPFFTACPSISRASRLFLSGPGKLVSRHGLSKSSCQNTKTSTGIGARMSHRIWRVTKLHPSRTSSGHQIRCCLFYLHFLYDILAPIPVQSIVSCPTCDDLEIPCRGKP